MPAPPTRAAPSRTPRRVLRTAPTQVVKTSGAAVGLDPGVTVTIAQLLECGAAPDQVFILGNDDGGGFPENFRVRTAATNQCLQPQILRQTTFDAVAFKARAVLLPPYPPRPRAAPSPQPNAQCHRPCRH